MGAVAPAARRVPPRSEERRWRRLVDRVRREDGKLFAHHRSLVEVAPVGGRRLAPACYVGGRRRSTTWTPLWLPAAATSRLLVGAVSYTHLRAHETRHDLVCRLLLE